MSRSAAFLSDVHGNLPALEAVLADIDARGIDEIYFLGDVLGKGPSVHEVLDLLRRRCRGAVYGNWDRLVLYSPEGERFGAPYYRERLTEAERAYLAALPETLELDFAGKRVLCYHGRFSIDRVVTPMFNNERENVEKAMYRFGPHDVTVMGDAHHPFLLTHQGRFLMNTGAVGNPCDRIPQASYLILHERGGAFSSEHVRVPYDLARAVSLALHAPDLPMLETYIRETVTAVYSRSYKPKAPSRSPWEDLPLPVYEAYASARGLEQALSSILAEQMRDLPAKSVCLLGVAGGNGLAFAATLPYAQILGVDVSEAYLAACRARFPQLGDRLSLLRLDLRDPGTRLPHAELVLADLLLEYTGLAAFVRQIESCAPRAVSCVLLPGGDEPDARFAEALSPVEKQRQEVDPTALVRAMEGVGLALRRVTSYPAPGQRLLLRMDFARP